MNKQIKEEARWRELRLVLKNNYNYNDTWEKAVELFHIRLKNKFFAPIDTIIKHQELKGEGFAIVTVQCALIESLASFRSGKIFNNQLAKGAPSYEYSKSRDMFVSFLNSSPTFKGVFWDTIENQTIYPNNAGDFYTNVRCGLMHEARTKGNWYINATQKPISKKETNFIVHEGQKIRLYRTILHQRLKALVKDYKKDLRQPGNNDLRRLFARKMDHLFNIDSDITYDWWIDK